MYLKSKINFIILCCCFCGACNFVDKQREKYYSDYNPEAFKNFQLTDRQMQDMNKIIDYLNSINFDGQFWLIDSTRQVDYGFCERPAEISYDSIVVLNEYKLKAGIIHHYDCYTYFKINGGFIDDNYGLLYTKTDSVEIPGVIIKRKLRESAKGGTWFFAETKL